MAKRKPPGRYKSWKAWSAAMQRKRRAKGGGKKRRKNPPRSMASVKRRGSKRKVSAAAWKRSGYARNKPRRKTVAKKRKATKRRRRTYRRNPPKPLKVLTDGLVHAAYITLGKAAARAVPQQFGLPTVGATGIATQAAVAVAAGLAIDRLGFLPRGAGEWVAAGALAAPVETFIAGAGIPILSPALSSYPAIGSYPRPRAALAMLPGPANGAGASSRGMGYYAEAPFGY